MTNAAGEGFISGLNEIVMLGGVMSLAAALVALWLVRERDIEREAPIELEAPQVAPRGERLPEPAAA